MRTSRIIDFLNAYSDFYVEKFVFLEIILIYWNDDTMDKIEGEFKLDKINPTDDLKRYVTKMILTNFPNRVESEIDYMNYVFSVATDFRFENTKILQ